MLVIVCVSMLQVTFGYEVQPNMWSIKYSMQDKDFLYMFWECDIVKTEGKRSAYFYYDSIYYDRFTDQEKKAIGIEWKTWWQLVIAIETVCNTQRWTANKVMLVDWFSDTFSYIRINANELENKYWMN